MDANSINAATKAAHDCLLSVRMVLLAVMEDVSPAVSKLLEPFTIHDGRTAEERHADAKTAILANAIKKLCDILDANSNQSIRQVNDLLLSVSVAPVTFGGITQSTAHAAAYKLAYAVWLKVKNVLEEQSILHGNEICTGPDSFRLNEALLMNSNIVRLIQQKLRAVVFDYQAARAAVEIESFKATGTLRTKPLDDDGYVPAAQLWPSRFSGYKKAKTFLDNHADEIRTKNPTKYRLKIHAADWIRFFSKFDESTVDKFDEEPPGITPNGLSDDFLEGVRQRYAGLAAKKKAGK